MCAYTDCDNVSSPLSIVEKMILDCLRNYKFENKYQERIIDTEILEKTRENINNEIQTLKQQKDSLHNLLERGIYDTNTFLDRSKIINTKITDLEQNIKNIDSELKSYDKNKTFLRTTKNLACKYFLTYPQSFSQAVS